MAEEKAPEAVEPQQEESLDDILSDFDQQMQPQQQQQQYVEPDRLANIEHYVHQQQQGQIRTEIDSEMGKLRGLNETLSNLSNQDLEGLVTARVQQDPRIGNAFAQRHSNPGAWDKVMRGMSQDIAKIFERPDPGVTADQSAMRAAVESQPDVSEPDAPNTKDLNNMNDAEFAHYKDSLM